MANRIRIIGGLWRSRVLEFPDVPGLRPTPGRVRETLFNWLRQDVAGAVCLDLFAGSGALGFEALSRGARALVQVERDPGACSALRANGAKLGAAAELHEMDALRFLDAPPRPFNLVFLDPPFGLGLVDLAIRRLEGGWLADGACVYLEVEAPHPLPELPSGWQHLKAARAGEVGYHLVRRIPIRG